MTLSGDLMVLGNKFRICLSAGGLLSDQITSQSFGNHVDSLGALNICTPNVVMVTLINIDNNSLCKKQIIKVE